MKRSNTLIANTLSFIHEQLYAQEPENVGEVWEEHISLPSPPLYPSPACALWWLQGGGS